MQQIAPQFESFIVGLGELRTTSSAQAVLVSVGLGSCVAVCAYDPATKVAGLAHILLPSSAEGRRVGPDAKFVDRAIPLLLESMEELGAGRSRLVVKLTGGAQMINGLALGDRQFIGERNVEAARDTLRLLDISIRSEHTGGTQGRTARLYAESGRLVVSLIGGSDYEI